MAAVLPSFASFQQTCRLLALSRLAVTGPTKWGPAAIAGAAANATMPMKAPTAAPLFPRAARIRVASVTSFFMVFLLLFGRYRRPSCIGRAFPERSGVREKLRLVGPATVERVAFKGRSRTSGPSSAPATLAPASLGSPGECPRDPWGSPALRGVLIGGIGGAEAPVATRTG